ncbi:sensor histidine kinase [Amycolatopsis pithecellobii]|uniref:histidine kinase n=1 Tax=Amycolatopsis pithecellobii TaxID=664692 RepID=A0A6N7Z2F8_9PSEU|nr:HAMP domain-containing sensor histidine kinase [Amycolatopsis pithecellobii]MTD55833.1 HAMP domain-containing protein [Amycolatopsis pithecellobii]
MRSRLLPVMLSLVVTVLLGLGIPLAISLANSELQRMFLDRLTITERLASLAQRPLVDGQATRIGLVLDRYDEVYGITSLIVDRDGKQIAGTTGPASTDPAVRSTLEGALAGRQPENTGTVMPWVSRPMVMAEPVMVDGEVRGAVVTISPTATLRERVLVWWALVLAGALVALAVAIMLALPVVHWILRPIHRLDEATGRVAKAVAEGETFAPSATDTGPPELRQLARSFDDMAASVSDVLAAQRAFVADASHQLRNPLTALNIRLRNLDEAVTKDGISEYTAAVSEAQRLNEVLDGLLTLARTETGSSVPTVTDASAALEERVHAWRPVAAARDVELVSDIPKGLSVRAVPRAVGAILDALLDNAVKFSVGHEPSKVEVVARRLGSRVTISVRDHGPGLDPSELDRATDRFWRSPAQQNVSGSGLGLAIVRQIADRSHGKLRLDLPEGGGLRVSVELPAS